MRLFSWNVNGVRAVIRKGALREFLEAEKPDVLCIQETKAKRDQVEVDFRDYQEFWNSAAKAGYSGTAVFVRNGIQVERVIDGLPEEIVKEFGLDEADKFGAPSEEGRVITVEFSEFFLVNVYTPNSKPELERLGLREKAWDPAFLKYLKRLEQEKPVVTCGDFNAAYTEIDLARPKENTKSAGFTAEERRGVSNLVEAGFVDTFRLKNPEARRYSWWSHWGHARERNVGWRIDYFFVSEALRGRILGAEIYEEYMGSDHCPVGVELEV